MVEYQLTIYLKKLQNFHSNSIVYLQLITTVIKIELLISIVKHSF